LAPGGRPPRGPRPPARPRPYSHTVRSCQPIFPSFRVIVLRRRVGTGEPGGDETVPPGQVLVVARVPPAPFLREDPVDRRALRLTLLHRAQAARPQQPLRRPPPR